MADVFFEDTFLAELLVVDFFAEDFLVDAFVEVVAKTSSRSTSSAATRSRRQVRFGEIVRTKGPICWSARDEALTVVRSPQTDRRGSDGIRTHTSDRPG